MEQELITKEMTIGDVIRKYPQTAQVFQRYGLSCVGCHVAFWETLEQGALGHGMNSETITHMIKDANTIAVNTQIEERSGALVHLSDRAIAKIKEFMAQEGKNAGVLRIGVVNGGCAGMSYDLSIEEKAREGDEVMEINGLSIVMNEEVKDLVAGARIDYVESLQATGFKIDNPNAKNSCGCGNSFS